MFKKVLKYFNNHKDDIKLIKTLIIASFFTVIVRVFGLIKESTIAYYFGVSQYIDFYLLALLFATFFVTPLGSSLGVLMTQSYIKIYNKFSQDNAANIFIKCQIFGLVCIMIIILIQAWILQTPTINNWILNKFIDLDERYVLALFPVCLISLMSTINKSTLTAREQFNTYNFLPIFVPLAILIALIISPNDYMFEALLLGTIIGFTLEFFIGGFFLRQVILNVNYNTFNNTSDEFKKIIKAMPSMLLSGIIMSGCLIVDQLMAVIAGEGAVTMINFGNRVPLGLISIIAITWTILHTNFVKYASVNNYKVLRKNLWSFSCLSLLILVPLCGLLSFFSKDLVVLLFEHGKFISRDTIIVSSIQSIYILHIPLYVVSMICIRVINTLENTNIVLFGNTLLLALNIILNLYFIKKYGVIGVPIATILSYGIMTLFWFLNANRLIRAQI